MPLPFNKSLDLKLLRLVKENPILYNTKHTKYLDFDEREVIWQKIGDALCRPAAEFGGIQCQIHFGDFQEDKHKPGFIENLQEYLPVNYATSWGVEKKILKAYRKHQGLTQLEAKVQYIKTARALPTYGVTFFLVKEKQKDKKKLVPRLLGISAQSILRLDENTKEILQKWPLTHVKTYHVGKSETFTLNFGDYSDKEYAVKTQDAHRIRDILEGYIDLIRRHMLAKSCVMQDESMAIGQDMVEASKGNVMQNITHNAKKIVSESFVGPSKLVPFAEGSQAQQGTQIVSVQQIIIADHAKNQQEILKGEVPLRGDMSMNCVRKLNRFNSNAVKIVTLLTDPSQATISEAQKIVDDMQVDLHAVEKGIKEAAERQDSEDARKMMMDELQDLKNYLNKLSYAMTPDQVDVEEAKQTAEDIAGLSTQMYFSVEPRTRRRSELLNRSRKSFIEGEKTDATIRRASFIAAATSALQTVDFAAQALHAEYRGPKLSAEQQRHLERCMEDKIAKLNAALALYLTAHADSNNIDYPAAINSMNTINELMPEIARDAQILASCKDAEGRKELEDDLRSLFAATKKICALTGTDDHEKMQEASNTYADMAGKLIFTFSRGATADKENEIIELAKVVGDKTSLLLVAANQLTELCADDPAAQTLDDVGVRTALAARDLLATAQLTAPAIREPHCRSALTASAEGLSSAVQQLAVSWKPLMEQTKCAEMEEKLHTRTMDVAKALDKLKESYVNLDGDMDTGYDTQQGRQRLKFVKSVSGAKSSLQGVEDLWDQSKPSLTEKDKAEAQRRLAQMLAQLNAAIAALATANSDRNNPDYETAEQAMNTISELLPQIVKDTDTVSCDRDEDTRRGMLKQIQALCNACREICASADDSEGLNDAASNFSSASGRLVFLISPTADKGKKKQILEISSKVCGKTSDMLGHVRQLTAELAAEDAKPIDKIGTTTLAHAQALLTAAQVTAPSIGEARCQNALVSATEQLGNSADTLAAACEPHMQPHQQLRQDLTSSHQELQNYLAAMAALCLSYKNGEDAESDTPQQERQRLKFITTVSEAKDCLRDAEKQLKEFQPAECVMLPPADVIAHRDRLQQQLARLNAAIAALVAAAADREHPDYQAAEKAMSTIGELMPKVVQGSLVAGAPKDIASQEAMKRQILELCDASRAICDGVASPEEMNAAAAKYGTVSRKLQFIISPAASKPEENQILDLSSAACGRASEFLSHVHRLTAQVAENDAMELDCKGARTADAAQALITTAQVTAPSITDEQCRRVVVSAAQQLASSAQQLQAACEPQAKPTQLRDQLQDSHSKLQHSLKALTAACEECGDDPAAVERRRLRFVTSAAGAKDKLRDAQELLKQFQPTEFATLPQADVIGHRNRLQQQLARLNAAIAAMVAAVADRENPDYQAAEEAMNTISELMPKVVQGSLVAGAPKDIASQEAMKRQILELCDASRAICDGVASPEEMNAAAAKYGTVSRKLQFIISAAASKPEENQILDLSSAACGRASEFLSHVHRLTAQVAENDAMELDCKGARTADAAQALITTAQVTAPSIADEQCRHAVVSAAQQLASSAQQLQAACEPQAKPTQLRDHLQDSHSKLQDSLKALTAACEECGDDPAAVERRRLRFVTSAAGAKDKLRDAQELLKQPVTSVQCSKEQSSRVQYQLSQQLARLNAAIAALAAAVADRENPDYAAANEAVTTIAELMPHVAEDARAAAATKEGAESAQLLQHARGVCDAGMEICAHADKPEALNEAAAKYAVLYGKIRSLVDPPASVEKENQILDLTSAACGRASELLSHVQQLTAQVAVNDAVELDRRGACTADAAQALLSVAQVTAPSMSEPGCRRVLVSAADRLRNSADELSSAYAPHAHAQPLRTELQDSHRKLQDTLRMLTDACTPEDEGLPVEEKQRLKFVSTATAVNNHLQAAEEHLKKPLVCALMSEQDAAVLQQRLAGRVRALQRAVADLGSAVAGPHRKDYVAANEAVRTISELTPQIVQESRTACSFKDDASVAAMLEQTGKLWAAARAICAGAANSQSFNEETKNLNKASEKLVFLVGGAEKPAAQTQAKVQGKMKPPVPSRGRAAPTGDLIAATRDFMDNLRAEETKAIDQLIDSKESKCPNALRTDEEKSLYRQVSAAMDDAEKKLSRAEHHLNTLYNADTVSIAGSEDHSVKIARTEHHMEETLAQAGVEVANLVSANYADKIDYKAALKPATTLPQLVNDIVDDGCIVCTSLEEKPRRAFLKDLIALCSSTKTLCHATKNDKEKLNAAAIDFGNHSTKLLHVVSCHANPVLEKELISRAKEIGDTASRLAVEASTIATADSMAATTEAVDGQMQDMCSAGMRYADAAGKLVYTAKCVAPSIYHPVSQETLVAAADHLSNKLNDFAKSWKPISNQEGLKNMTEESRKLEQLLEALRRDVKVGKLGKRWIQETEVDLDTPLKQLIVQIIDDAEKMSTNTELSTEERKEYGKYVGRLKAALRALDNANARCQRAPHDRVRRNQLDNAIQDLQMTLLQSRPRMAGKEQSYVVDLREFLQELATGAEHMSDVAIKNSTVSSKKPTELIRDVCSRMRSGAVQLMNEAELYGELSDTELDHTHHIDEFGEECDEMVKELKSSVDAITDQNLVILLKRKLLLITESCNLLRFATKTALANAQAAAYEATLNDLEDFDSHVLQPLMEAIDNDDVLQRHTIQSGEPARALPRAACAAARCIALRRPQHLGKTLTNLATECTQKYHPRDVSQNISCVAWNLRMMSSGISLNNANFGRRKCEVQPVHNKIIHELMGSTLAQKDEKDAQQVQVLQEADINKLLLPIHTPTVTGTKEELEENLQRLATKVNSISGTVVLSVQKPASLARSLHAAAGAAAQLADTAAALAASKKPVERKRIEEDSREMCFATYHLLKISELVAHDPKRPNSKRRLLDACRALNDAINKLVRSAGPAGPAGRLGLECGQLARSVELQQAALQGAPQPCSALPYAACLDTMQEQQQVIQKLDSDQAMSREEFVNSLNFVASAVDNSAECAAHCAYLLSVSEKEEHVGNEGLVDVPKLQHLVTEAQDSCAGVIHCRHVEDIKEEKKDLEKNIEKLVKALDEAAEKTKPADLKQTLTRCRVHVDQSAKELYTTIDQDSTRNVIIGKTMRLLGELHATNSVLEHSELVPIAGEVSAHAQQMRDEVLENTKTLLTKTQDLIKEVKSAPEDQEVMKWVMFTKRKSVVDAFEALLKSVRSCGQRAKFVETVEDDDGAENSYIQIQVDIVKKWLLKPAVRAEVKKAGQQAVTNIILIANKMSEDLQGGEKEEMNGLVGETMSLLQECSTKNDQEKNSLLMDRVRELHKMIEREVVTRLVEDFMDVETPLQDLEIMAEAERDPAKREFLLKKKIEELLAQLGRVTRTARLIADTGNAGPKTTRQLNQCTDQTTLLAPQLVKAAEQRINSMDDKAAIEHYQALLAQYAASLAEVRQLCDSSVDPMDFVQTAGETMQRMRDESSKHNDPKKCYYTSQAITKLADRVINVGMSSRSARSDPELCRLLSEAQSQLSAATAAPPPDTRASALPDWKDTTALILRTTGEVEAVLGGENIFNKQPDPNQPIYKEALNLHVAIRDWSSRDNEIVAVAKRMAVLMAKLSDYMNTDKQRELLATSKSIVSESHEVARLAKKLAQECTDVRIRNNLLRACEKIPTISGQLKMLTTVKGSSLGHHGTHEDKEAMDMLVGNAQGLMISIQDVIKAAASASVKIMSQRGPRMKWVRKNYY